MEIDTRKIKYAMVNHCFTGRKLAKTAGVSEATINLIITHGRRPNLETLGKISKALAVPSVELIKD